MRAQLQSGEVDSASVIHQLRTAAASLTQQRDALVSAAAGRANRRQLPQAAQLEEAQHTGKQQSTAVQHVRKCVPVAPVMQAGDG